MINKNIKKKRVPQLAVGNRLNVIPILNKEYLRKRNTLIDLGYRSIGGNRTNPVTINPQTTSFSSTGGTSTNPNVRNPVKLDIGTLEKGLRAPVTITPGTRKITTPVKKTKPKGTVPGTSSTTGGTNRQNTPSTNSQTAAIVNSINSLPAAIRNKAVSVNPDYVNERPTGTTKTTTKTAAPATKTAYRQYIKPKFTSKPLTIKEEQNNVTKKPTSASKVVSRNFVNKPKYIDKGVKDGDLTINNPLAVPAAFAAVFGAAKGAKAAINYQTAKGLNKDIRSFNSPSQASSTFTPREYTQKTGNQGKTIGWNKAIENTAQVKEAKRVKVNDWLQQNTSIAPKDIAKYNPFDPEFNKSTGEKVKELKSQRKAPAKTSYTPKETRYTPKKTSYTPKETNSISKKISSTVSKSEKPIDKIQRPSMMPSAASKTRRFRPMPSFKGLNRMNAAALPLQLLGEYGVMKDTRRKLEKLYGKAGADDYIKQAQKRSKEVSRLSEEGQRMLDGFTMLGTGGRIPRKGFGDVLLSGLQGGVGGLATGGGPGAILGLASGLISGGINSFAEKKKNKEIEKQIAASKAIELEQSRNLDNAYMANYKPNYKPSLFPEGGQLNPVPNNYIVVKGRKNKVINGEMLPTTVPTSDTLYYQDYGKWGPNLRGMDIPPPFATDSRGKVIPPKSKGVKVMFATKANGGQLNTTGIPNSNSVKLNNSAELIVNPDGTTSGTHETGNNIPVINPKGQITAEVEPGEIKMKRANGEEYALSKRLGFAQMYQKLDARIKELDASLLHENDVKVRNTRKREIDKIRKEMDRLPLHQEAVKNKMGIASTPRANNGLYLNPRPVGEHGIPAATTFGEKGWLKNTGLGRAWGKTDTFVKEKLGGWGTVGQAALPFVTNLINNRTLNKSMKLIDSMQPTPIKYRPIDANVDYSGQTSEVNRGYREAVGATRRLSNSQTAAQMKGDLASARISAMNPIIESANNESRKLRNLNTTTINEVGAANAARQDEFNRYKLENRVGLNLTKIQGRNAAVDNLYSVIKQGNLKESDKTMLELIMKTYDNNGVFTRQLADLAAKYGLIVPENRIQK